MFALSHTQTHTYTHTQKMVLPGTLLKSMIRTPGQLYLFVEVPTTLIYFNIIGTLES